MNIIFFSIAKKLLLWSANYLYDYVDTDADGTLSKRELSAFHNQLKVILTKVRKLK